MSITKSLLFLSLLTVISGCAHQDLANFPKRYHRDLADHSTIAYEASFDEGRCHIILRNAQTQQAALTGLRCPLFKLEEREKSYLEKAVTEFSVIYGVDIRFSSGEGYDFLSPPKSPTNPSPDWYGVQFIFWGEEKGNSALVRREIAFISDGTLFDHVYYLRQDNSSPSPSVKQ